MNVSFIRCTCGLFEQFAALERVAQGKVNEGRKTTVTGQIVFWGLTSKSIYKNGNAIAKNDSIPGFCVHDFMLLAPWARRWMGARRERADD